VKELRRTNREEKVLERVIKHWQTLWEMDAISVLGDALKQRSVEEGNG
jgi:trehalose/maltose hydrolase-like predicted phosphorylase